MAEADDFDGVFGRRACQSNIGQTIEQREGGLEGKIIVVIIVEPGAGQSEGKGQVRFVGDHQEVVDRYLVLVCARERRAQGHGRGRRRPRRGGGRQGRARGTRRRSGNSDRRAGTAEMVRATGGAATVAGFLAKADGGCGGRGQIAPVCSIARTGTTGGADETGRVQGEAKAGAGGRRAGRDRLAKPPWSPWGPGAPRPAQASHRLVYRDAQPIAADGDLVHPLDDPGGHRHALTEVPRALPQSSIWQCRIEAQDGVTGGHVDVLQADHHTGIAPDGHLG